MSETSTQRRFMIDDLKELLAAEPNDILRKALVDLCEAIDDKSATFVITADTPFKYVTHNLDSTDLHVTIWARQDAKDQVEPVIHWTLAQAGVGIVDANTIAIEFDHTLLTHTPPREYKVVIAC